jgi:hypothetical protein
MEWFVAHGQHLWSDDHYPLFANSRKVLTYTLLCGSDWHNVSSFFLACSLAFTLTLTSPVQAAFEPKNRPYDVEHYRIEIHLDAATGKYESLTTIRFKPTTSLKQTEALAQFVQFFVLTPSRYDSDFRARMIGVLEEAKTPFAQAALEQIVKGTTNTRIRELAQLPLAKNFPPTSGKGATTVP